MSVKIKNTTASALDKSSVARYIQLATIFRKRIESGEWTVGSKIPTVAQLVEDCGVASMTIRQALGQLEKEGLIERFRAKGTFVKKQPRRDIWCEVKTDWNGLLISRADAQISVLSQRSDVVLQQEKFETGKVAASYTHLTRLHVREDEPFLIADVYIDQRLCEQLSESDYMSKTAMRLVFDLPNITIVDAHQTLTVDSADLDTATYLDIELAAPVVKVQRIAIDDKGDLVLIANGVYRGDMVRIDMQLLK
ncbi:GntR family transcriptional regulator [Marinomonas balearica]|uniref:GntR family transcriptional regulator n=1 Tax=Marinomonas balearica TaxID=491947 RepID=A0A4R6MH01_9GAMM|nr:GntR family transcriptional regulator [Marinomonas balearica]TDP01209.1 GntR family transcriptional regulator [Marinomonas balearica]